MNDSGDRDPRVYFAAERTFLAWIRTGLGLMGVGFAVARFGLFLRQMRATEMHAATQKAGISVWSGVALVTLGVIVIVAAVLDHFRLIRELRSGTWMPGRVSRNAVTLGLILAGIGIAMAVYLLVVH